MADLTPDTTRPGYSEVNVTTRGGLKVGSAYDLALFPELGKTDKGVLVVSMGLNFAFKDGEDASGNTLSWTAGDKATFISGFTSATKDVWNNKYRITTTSTVPMAVYQDIGVQFQFNTKTDGWTWGMQLEMKVTKIPAGGWQGSDTDTSSTWIWGAADLDSEDNTAVTKGAPSGAKQCGSAHEFGHMLGHRDEYPAAPDHCANWVADFDSIMHSGEQVRERHYAMFAAWITDQFAEAARLSGTPIVYKVNGVTDMSNANL